MRVILACIVALGFAQPASATEVRNFFAPEVEGTRIAACLDSGACGKPAADAFCRVQGYDRAMIFQRETQLPPARSIWASSARETARPFGK